MTLVDKAVLVAPNELLAASEVTHMQIDVRDWYKVRVEEVL
jgi:hypothetical protein